MVGVVTDLGEVAALTYLVGQGSPEALVLKLYKSDTTPSETSVAGDFTEADFAGYAPIPLTPASWSVGAPSSSAAYAKQTFTSSAAQAAQLIYGYLLVQENSGNLILAERFIDGPYTIENLNDRVKVTPTIVAANEV
jgi:hypothetical protein